MHQERRLVAELRQRVAQLEQLVNLPAVASDGVDTGSDKLDLNAPADASLSVPTPAAAEAAMSPSARSPNDWSRLDSELSLREAGTPAEPAAEALADQIAGPDAPVEALAVDASLPAPDASLPAPDASLAAVRSDSLEGESAPVCLKVRTSDDDPPPESSDEDVQ
jgi:hypothetical protein